MFVIDGMVLEMNGFPSRRPAPGGSVTAWQWTPPVELDEREQRVMRRLTRTGRLYALPREQRRRARQVAELRSSGVREQILDFAENSSLTGDAGRERSVAAPEGRLHSYSVAADG